MQNLKLPKKERPKGLFLYCNACHKHYSSDSVIKCKCNLLVYKAMIHIPDTKRKVKTRTFDTKDFVTAFSLFKSFKEELKMNSFQKMKIKKETQTPTLLIECFAYYMGFLNNIDVPLHKHKDRSSRGIQHFDSFLKIYKEALEFNNIDCDILKFTEVNDDMVGLVHDYLLTKKKYANKSYNNAMASYRGFTSHVINKFRLNYQNPFLGVEKLIVTNKNLSIQEDEFLKLLKITTIENGFKTVNRRSKPYTLNIYRTWLIHGFLLGLYTGGRGEEVNKLKWSGISLNENGSFNDIKVIHFKESRAKGHLVSEKDNIIKEFSITEELGALLIEMGYATKKGTDEYLFAPEREKRLQIARELSQGFSHYYGLLNTGKDIKFKNLRKTFITSAYKKYGAAAIALTGHKNTSVIVTNYNDKDVVKKDAQKGFGVFNKDKDEKDKEKDIDNHSDSE